MLPEKRDIYARRIASSVVIDAAGCWIWQKKKSNNGYGEFAFGGGKNGRAHRVSYFAHIGEIPDGMDVCHRCDVRSCVNPDHLFLGTRSENLIDASKKNRVSREHQKKGSSHPASKLLEADVKEIRSRLSLGHSKASIARSFAVSDRVILLIARGQAWRHV
ncbi:hypothetical protein G3A56_15930 [Rhizobium oryzihabitans]|uniref:HNH nuclease domain-containing protein n=1 Tax=Rhizobium oryzihabitans TaxID=2267833 RepID=A0A7L5BKM4_9HYPH|nr:hypothetical protein G3A56_15930 [Rhizobium oryzihabitans]